MAMRCHPDKGGTDDLMRQLNEEYRLLRQNAGQFKRNETQLCVGATVWVGETECLVTYLSQHSFVVKAKYKSRTGIFDRSTGRSVSNPWLIAVIR